MPFSCYSPRAGKTRRDSSRDHEFLESWNTQKSVWRIWQHFSCLLDEGISKIWKKLNSHDGFLSYLQNSTAKAPWEFNFFHIFGIPSSSRHEKCCRILQTLFWIFPDSKNSQCMYIRSRRINIWLDPIDYWWLKLKSASVCDWPIIIKLGS